MTADNADGGPGPPGQSRIALDDPVRADERRRLALELHDVVTHHLANVALRTMGGLDLVDLGGLRLILSEVNSAAGSALVELRLLARVLTDDREGAIEVGTPDQLSQHVAPSDAAAAWRHRLDEAGLLAEYAVPADADHLARSVQSTIVRTFEANAEAALRHGAAVSRCSILVHLEPTQVLILSVTTPPPVDVSAARLDPELRGLRERVNLTCGHFAAEVMGAASGSPQWVVTVAVPLD